MLACAKFDLFALVINDFCGPTRAKIGAEVLFTSMIQINGSFFHVIWERGKISFE